MSGASLQEDPEDRSAAAPLFAPLTLPSGVTLKNRIAKSAMSDSLGDGGGYPTDAQAALYRRWAEGGAALALVGEVQFDPFALEAPGNLLLAGPPDGPPDDAAFVRFTASATRGMPLWAQIGHAGALAYQPLGRAVGPSALEIGTLRVAEMAAAEISALPDRIAAAAAAAKRVGFAGVQIHAAHGFLLSQFLSPLFNRRGDAWGGGVTNRARLLIETIAATRARVGADYPVSVKINGSDLAAGGLSPEEALEVVRLLHGQSVDLLDISAGAYFPGAASASEGGADKSWLLDLTAQARAMLDAPVAAAAGFRDRRSAVAALVSGQLDLVSMARPLALWPDLPERWREKPFALRLPRFGPSAPGAVTAWYTLQLRRLADADASEPPPTPDAALAAVTARDAAREARWRSRQAGGARSGPSAT